MRISLTVLLLAFSSVQAANAQSSLNAVVINGARVVSDSALDVTWADVVSPANLPWSASGAPGSAQGWAQSLNTMVNANGPAGYAGLTTWQLATGDGTQPASPPNRANEIGSLFFTELANPAGAPLVDQPIRPLRRPRAPG